MEPAVNSDGKQSVFSVCPATGLPVYTRQEWTDVKFGENHYMSFSIIGEKILVGQTIGTSDLKAAVAATKFTDKIIEEVFGSQGDIVYVEDFTELKSLTSDSKKYYNTYFENKKQLKSVIICTLSPLMAMSIKMGRKLNLIKYNIQVEKDISNAVKCAAEILSSDSTIHEEKTETLMNEPDNNRCLFTGLPITEKPEWVKVDLGGPTVSFKFIGNRILHSDLHDWVDIDVKTCRRLFEEREKVLNVMLKPDDRFVEIRNYTEFRRGTSKELREEFIRLMVPSKDRVMAYLGYNAPLSVKLGFNVGQKIYTSPFPWRICSNYEKAIRSAVIALKSNGYKEDGAFNVVKNDDWELTFSGFYVRFEILDGNILHRITKGYLKAEYVEEVNGLQEAIIRASGLDKKTYYFLNGVQELEGASFSARKIYFEKMSVWKELYPDCRLNVVYGANRMVRTSFSMTRYLRPFKIWMADSLEEAVALVEEDKIRKKSTLDSENQALLEKDGIVRTYSDELIYFLGNINWEIDGFDDAFVETDSNHPFKVVYDAVTLIKMDIDELFRERERTRVALVEGEEVSRALLNATSDYSMLIQTDGTILAVNETCAHRLGQSQELMKNQNISKYLDADLHEYRLQQQEKVVLSGKPVRFEDEDSGVLYDNTIYPVFSAEGTVDRLAIYSRDITELKKAEKHIQALTQEIIKAQENERQRIARDLHDNVAQDLASLIISSDTLFEGFPDIPHEVRRRTMKFSRILKRAISSIRDLAYDLRPPSLDQLGFVRTLSQYCTDFSESSMIGVDFYSAGLDKLDLDFDTEINLYRLLQEALNNVKKHADAGHITIRLITSYPDIILRIEDNGKGFQPEKRISEALNEKRMGLKSMEERVKLLSGEFTIKSRPGEGTMILVKLPFSPEKGALSTTILN